MRSGESDLGYILNAYSNADVLHEEYGEKQTVKYTSDIFWTELLSSSAGETEWGKRVVVMTTQIFEGLLENMVHHPFCFAG